MILVEDPNTGEIRDLDVEWGQLHAQAATMRPRRPETPLELDALLRDIEDLGFAIADLLREVNDARYEAEITHERIRKTAFAKHVRVEKTVAAANALADLDALTAYADLLHTKAVFHHAEDTNRALGRKHYGLMNTNKGIQPMTANWHRRTP
ncbi:hypothetical protein [Microbacterium aurantiacum]|uniref:hypothetical protein n=1 Tax=Microbacterium aurantiacum TaxID=162393 RepID=UPI00341EFA4D